LNKNRNGFSLIEVLIGLVLLAIGLLAIAGMQITSVRGNFFSSNLSQASVVGQDRLEELRNRPYGHGDLGAGNHSDGAIAGTIFTRDYTVAVIPGTTMLSIVVNVRWRDTTDHTISFSTVRSQ
jgi:type IV pilus assembly protein PilV